MDDIDLAQQHALSYTQRQILRALAFDGEDPLHDANGKRICLDCEKRIPQKRLNVLPSAVRCIACQEKRERGYRQSG
jgi:DnaK suppressor protein